jgi:hypothetical protein
MPLRPAQGFFVARAAGNYTFHISGDNFCQLNGTYVLVRSGLQLGGIGGSCLQGPP